MLKCLGCDDWNGGGKCWGFFKYGGVVCCVRGELEFGFVNIEVE